jgi:hypothetical protein
VSPAVYRHSAEAVVQLNLQYVVFLAEAGAGQQAILAEIPCLEPAAARRVLHMALHLWQGMVQTSLSLQLNLEVEVRAQPILQVLAEK